MKKSQHDCPCCVCGQTDLSWSDREAFVFPSDLETIANTVVNCALDHSYDRTGSGIPYGMDRIHRNLEDALYPIVDKHLSAINPQWKEHTIDMNHEQRQNFLAELLSKIKEVVSFPIA